MGQQARRFDSVKAQVLSNLAEMLVRQLEEKWVAALQVRGPGGGGLCVCNQLYCQHSAKPKGKSIVRVWGGWGVLGGLDGGNVGGSTADEGGSVGVGVCVSTLKVQRQAQHAGMAGTG